MAGKDYDGIMKKHCHYWQNPIAVQEEVAYERKTHTMAVRLFGADAAVWNIQAPLAAFLATNSISAVILVLVNMVIQGLIYLPFYKVVERDMVAMETAEEAEA